ncbi:MAG: APC family permease, partial [Pseudoclavibacter sp.]
MSQTPTGELKRNQLGVPSIVFLVLAAVAPLTAAVVVMPIAIGNGNGGGIVVSVLLWGVAIIVMGA